MEMQGPTAQRQQDGGIRLVAETPVGEERPRPYTEQGSGPPVFMVLNLAQESGPRGSEHSSGPDPSSQLGTYVTVRLENGLLTLGRREDPQPPSPPAQFSGTEALGDSESTELRDTGNRGLVLRGHRDGGLVRWAPVNENVVIRGRTEEDMVLTAAEEGGMVMGDTEERDIVMGGTGVGSMARRGSTRAHVLNDSGDLVLRDTRDDEEVLEDTGDEDVELRNDVVLRAPADGDMGDEQVASFLVEEIGELQVNLGEALGLARKGVLLVYHCPEPDCAKAFNRKQQLKVHLLSHTEGQRPFKCTVDSCGWSFTTLYKLKRHLQSHDKQRPFSCTVTGCSKSFTTVYNLKAHLKAHEQENMFRCDTCGESFPTATKLGAHQRTHFEPERPYTCEFPGCDKTFITVTALFSHHRAHVREQEQFVCNFPGCNKQYDKACRLKIHLRSHTGERPFICDFEGCGWSFTSMSKLLRHKRKHEDDRRYHCTVEGCGKSFTRAEHLKGHSITHLGTKPFECPVEGCGAKFSARSSLYIHSKKHLQDVDAAKTRCLVSSCSKVFTSKQSLKSHMVKQHNFSQDLLSQLEATSSLTPSSELTSSGQTDLSNLDLSSLFTNITSNASGISPDLALVNSGILTIDVSSVGSTLGGNLTANATSLVQPVDPLVLVSNSENPHTLDSSLLLGAAASILQQSALNLDDVQTVNAEALGSLASLSMRSSSQDLHGLTSSNSLSVETSTLTPSVSLGVTSSVPEVLTQTKADRSILPPSEVMGQQEGSKVVTQFVFPNPTGSYSSQKETEYNAGAGSSLLDSGGSARTDYRAIQLAKSKKQGCTNNTGSSPTQRKSKGVKPGPATPSSVIPGSRFCSGAVVPNVGLTLRDPAVGSQFVQIQLLQDDPTADGDMPFQLNAQSPASHSQLTDLPVHILQEPATSTEDDAASDNSQFTGSTINLQDLE
ncbi:zinc finger protein ZXDC [Bombina bombina]|uniref:zinc finger protein ZXDC n=1 Tax=Bombina bombina TaxID=8345 RepID=UPI00235ADF03|nr:zinc finger protein ZXDC [Bombina bombina]